MGVAGTEGPSGLRCLALPFFEVSILVAGGGIALSTAATFCGGMVVDGAGAGGTNWSDSSIRPMGCHSVIPSCQ